MQAFGDLLVTFKDQITIDGPIFTFDDFKPGDCSQASEIEVANAGINTALVAIRSENVGDLGNLSQALSIVISENSTDLYGGSSSTGPKTLHDFFTDSANPDGIPLSNLAGSQTTTYLIQICFYPDAGNEYQEKSLEFDIVFGELLPDPGELPLECIHLQGIITEIVEGTPEDDRLHTTTASELILLYEGDDRVDASSGDDCIVGSDGGDRIDAGTGNDVVIAGLGNDRVRTGTGNDFVYGGDGNDRIDTGSGEDVVWGGEGNDDIETGSGNDEIHGGPGNDDIDSGDDNDLIYGDEGNDEIRSGSGDDIIHGGLGNDTIRAGSGEDEVYGDEGNDVLRGGSGDDYLDGGPDIDVLKGNSGDDTCIAGENLSSCESP